jgi:hypothetical protein
MNTSTNAKNKIGKVDKSAVAKAMVYNNATYHSIANNMGVYPSTLKRACQGKRFVNMVEELEEKKKKDDILKEKELAYAAMAQDTRNHRDNIFRIYCTPPNSEKRARSLPSTTFVYSLTPPSVYSS